MKNIKLEVGLDLSFQRQGRLLTLLEGKKKLGSILIRGKESAWRFSGRTYKEFEGEAHDEMRLLQKIIPELGGKFELRFNFRGYCPSGPTSWAHFHSSTLGGHKMAPFLEDLKKADELVRLA